MEHQDEAGTELLAVAPSTSTNSQESTKTMEVDQNSLNAYDWSPGVLLHNLESSMIRSPSSPANLYESILDSDDRDPSLWDADEVATFLVSHGCGDYTHKLLEQNFNGLSLLEATEMEIVNLTDREVGPKIFALVQELIAKYQPENNQNGVTDNGNEEGEGVPSKKKTRENEPAFRCKTKVYNTDEFSVASVHLMKHAPLAEMWGIVKVGLVVEVLNYDYDLTNNETEVFWVAKVIDIQGYLVLLRYIGFENDSSSDFWIHICSPEIHHFSWCFANEKKLYPPLSIADKLTSSDWIKYLNTCVTNAHTLPSNFRSMIENSLESRYQKGDFIEALDAHNISQYRLAKVHNVVGRRLHVKYLPVTPDQGRVDFWFHEESRLIYPVGWAKTVEHKIVAPSYYNPSKLPPNPYHVYFGELDLEEGMMLEAVNPLTPCVIGVGTIMKVLRFGYVMVRLEDNVMESGKEENGWHCYHITDMYVLPCGFCKNNGLPLAPPSHSENDFEWDSYLALTQSPTAPVKGKKHINHGLEVGMKVEAADLLDPQFISPATITHIAGALMKIHFDGWDEEYSQWVDIHSVDVYPVGWCELVGHELHTRNAFKPVKKEKARKRTRRRRRRRN